MNGYCQLGRNEFELNGCKPAFSWLTVSKTNNIVRIAFVWPPLQDMVRYQKAMKQR